MKGPFLDKNLAKPFLNQLLKLVQRFFLSIYISKKKFNKNRYIDKNDIKGPLLANGWSTFGF